MPGPSFSSTRSSQPRGRGVRAALLQVLLGLEVAAADAGRRDGRARRRARRWPTARRRAAAALWFSAHPAVPGSGDQPRRPSTSAADAPTQVVQPEGRRSSAAGCAARRRRRAGRPRSACGRSVDGRRGVRGPGGDELGAERGDAGHADAGEEAAAGPAAACPRRRPGRRARRGPRSARACSAVSGFVMVDPIWGRSVQGGGGAQRRAWCGPSRTTAASGAAIQRSTERLSGGRRPARRGSAAAPRGARPTSACR